MANNRHGRRPPRGYGPRDNYSPNDVDRGTQGFQRPSPRRGGEGNGGGDERNYGGFAGGSSWGHVPRYYGRNRNADDYSADSNFGTGKIAGYNSFYGSDNEGLHRRNRLRHEGYIGDEEFIGDDYPGTER